MIDCPVCAAGDIEHRRLLSVPEVAELRAAHPHTVRRAITSGELVAERVGRTFVVERVAAERWHPRNRGRPAKEKP